MHKSLLLLLTMTLLCLVVHSTETNFSKALRNCTPFSDSGTVNSAGMSINSVKNIMGWQGDKCVYKESVSFSGIESDIVCKFSRPQIEELASVLDAYELMQKYSGEKPDFSDLEAAQKNPVSKAWQKYLADENICSVKTNQE